MNAIQCRRAIAQALVLGTALAIAGCVAPSQPPPQAVSVRPRTIPATPPPPVPLAADWRDRPQTPGDWSWHRDVKTGLSEAVFGYPQMVSVFCLSPGHIRIGVQYRTGPMTVRTTAFDRTVPITDQTFMLHPHPSAVIDFRADDPLLDAMAFSRGRFSLEFVGEASMYLPSWPEIGRVVEDCRQGA